MCVFNKQIDSILVAPFFFVYVLSKVFISLAILVDYQSNLYLIKLLRACIQINKALIISVSQKQKCRPVGGLLRDKSRTREKCLILRHTYLASESSKVCLLLWSKFPIISLAAIKVALLRLMSYLEKKVIVNTKQREAFVLHVNLLVMQSVSSFCYDTLFFANFIPLSKYIYCFW